jgi:hypothetical protein
MLLKERGFSAITVLAEQLHTGSDHQKRNYGENDQTLRLLHSKNLLPVNLTCRLIVPVMSRLMARSM